MPAKINAKTPGAAKPVQPRVKTPKLTDINGQSRDRRAQIADAAAKLFAEFGYEATSVRQIADAVGILPGSLYHHFDTKEEMLHDVLKARLAKMAHDNQRIAALPVDAEHRFVASVVMRFRQYVENWEFHSLLLQEGRFFRRHPDFAYVVEAKGDAFAVQQQNLRDGMDAGLFRTDMDTYLMIGAISRLLSSAASWFRSGDIFSSDRPSHYSLDDMIDFHVDSALRLVRTSARVAEPIPRKACERLLQWDDEAKTIAD